MLAGDEALGGHIWFPQDNSFLMAEPHPLQTCHMLAARAVAVLSDVQTNDAVLADKNAS